MPSHSKNDWYLQYVNWNKTSLNIYETDQTVDHSLHKTDQTVDHSFQTTDQTVDHSLQFIWFT